MANTPEGVRLKWLQLESKGVKISSEIWGLWEIGCLKELDQIMIIAQSAGGGALSVESAREIGICADRMTMFIKSIKKSAIGQNAIIDDNIVVEETVKDLIAHYIGNDLLKIVLIVDVGGEHPLPVPADHVARVITAVNDMRDFTDQLREKTAEKDEDTGA